MSDTQSPALDMADFLTSLAEHLRSHPHLPRAIVHAGHDDGELQLVYGKEAESLHAWFSSLEDAQITVRPWFDDVEHAYVVVRGSTKSGTALRVWDKVPGLGAVLGYTKDSPKDEVPLADSVLVDFVLTSEPQAVS